MVYVRLPGPQDGKRIDTDSHLVQSQKDSLVHKSVRTQGLRVEGPLCPEAKDSIILEMLTYLQRRIWTGVWGNTQRPTSPTVPQGGGPRQSHLPNGKADTQKGWCLPVGVRKSVGPGGGVPLWPRGIEHLETPTGQLLPQLLHALMSF